MKVCNNCRKKYKLITRAATVGWKETLTRRIEKCCGYDEKELEKAKKPPVDIPF